MVLWRAGGTQRWKDRRPAVLVLVKAVTLGMVCGGMLQVQNFYLQTQARSMETNALSPPGSTPSLADPRGVPQGGATLTVATPPAASAFTPPQKKTFWDPKAIRDEFHRVLKRIAESPIEQEPFPHLAIQQLFSDDFYSSLMAEIPPITEYTAQSYAGTRPTYEAIEMRDPGMPGKTIRVPDDCVKPGEEKKRGRGPGGYPCFYRNVQMHSPNSTKGHALAVDKMPDRYPLWVAAFRLVHSANFTRLLVAKFLLPGGEGIPEWKRRRVGDGELRNTAGMRIEPSMYHLMPHVDVFQKIVTWQFFHPNTSLLKDREAGTFFYKPKPGTDWIINDRANPHWLDYRFFDAVRQQPVVPNYFFAFAPNPRTWHGASIMPNQVAGVPQQRRTFLGFIVSKQDNDFHHFNKDDWVDKTFYL